MFKTLNSIGSLYFVTVSTYDRDLKVKVKTPILSLQLKVVII